MNDEMANDEMAVAFPAAVAAARAALQGQRALSAAPWPDQAGPLKIRMGLHTDEAVPCEGQYPYHLMNRCAPLTAARS